jgi:hypothetical protein
MPVGENGSNGPVIAADRRSDEDARLRTRYTVVTKQLVQNERRSLDRAVDRLMAHPALAARLVAPAHAS